MVVPTMEFWINGRIPPPTTIAMKIPEAFSVYLPRPSVARLKMQPHMIEVQRPIRTRNTVKRGTLFTAKEPLLKPIMETPFWGLTNMEMSTNTIPTQETVSSCARLEILPLMKPEVRRPTSINSQ